MQKSYIYLSAILLANAIVLFFGLFTLSISGYEAKIFYEGSSLLHHITNASTSMFGLSDFGLRVPFILLHLANVVLLFFYAKSVIKKDGDRYLVLLIYIMMPGVLSSALLVSKAGLVIFCVLLYLLLEERHKIASNALLLVYAFLDNSFSLLFLALFFYAAYKKDGTKMALLLALFGLNMYLFGFDDGGKPKGYFLDTLGALALICSPLLFVYFVYSLYRVLLKEQKSILWFISFVALLFAILLSFRQKIVIEDFAPFLVVGVPIVARVFLEAYRVRLPEYRHFYKVGFCAVFGSLALMFTLTIFNRPLYLIHDNPKKHFAYHYQIAKELAVALKNEGVKSISTSDKELQLRLKFYGIQDGGEYLISTKKEASFEKKIEISYFDKVVESYYLVKVSH